MMVALRSGLSGPSQLRRSGSIGHGSVPTSSDGGWPPGASKRPRSKSKNASPATTGCGTSRGTDAGGFDSELVELVPDGRIVWRWGFVGPQRREGPAFDSLLTITLHDAGDGFTKLGSRPRTTERDRCRIATSGRRCRARLGRRPRQARHCRQRTRSVTTDRSGQDRVAREKAGCAD
jgi:hypothetical protein